MKIDEEAGLAAGTYTLRAWAQTIIDHEVPPDRAGEASYDFAFEIAAPCPADLDGDGAVNVGDVLVILSRWGDAGGPGDLDGNGTVGFGDLLVVLGAWGACA